jgi:hypothetical protein
LPISKKNDSTLRLYQPPTLFLEKGKTIHTVEGDYTPQINETWHSQDRYQKLEKQILHPGY